MNGKAAVLTARGVAKSYGPTQALKRVDIDIRAGEVHALIGENGAGKSTLVKIFAGVVFAEAGEIMLEERPYRPRSPLEARAAGVATAFQELSLLPNLTVAVNLLLPRQMKGLFGLNSPRRAEAWARQVLARFEVSNIHPSALVGDLSLAAKQRVEIIRAVSRAPRLLVLDEPTAALAEPEWLFRIVRRLIGDGVAVLYISHRLAEVRQLCARGTVLRNGETISTMELAQARDADIFRLMVGGSLAGPDSEPARRPSAPDAGATPGIKVTDLTGRSVRGVSFEIARGEIVGVAALEGQGQRELFRMLAGLERAVSGAIEADGLPIQAGSSVSAFAKNAGVGFVPEERKTEGLFPGLKTAANISLPAIGKLARLGFVSGRREYSLVSSEARRVDLEDRYLPMKITALSGGNQQKALIGRVLLSGARHLVLFDPTRGVDVATKQVIYRIIRQFAAAGGSVLIYSTELAELTRLADRCLVLYRGAISGELSSDALTESGLVALATGHALEAAE